MFAGIFYARLFWDTRQHYMILNAFRDHARRFNVQSSILYKLHPHAPKGHSLYSHCIRGSFSIIKVDIFHQFHND